MKLAFSAFRDEDDGAVTVDWVLLTAAIAGFAAIAVPPVLNGAEDAAEAVGVYLEATDAAAQVVYTENLGGN